VLHQVLRRQPHQPRVNSQLVDAPTANRRPDPAVERLTVTDRLLLVGRRLARRTGTSGRQSLSRLAEQSVQTGEMSIVRHSTARYQPNTIGDDPSTARRVAELASLLTHGACDARAMNDLTDRVRTFAEERDWQQFHTPKNLAMALAGEVGELIAEFQWLTPEQAAVVMSDPDAGSRVKAEMGDVMIYLTRLADVLGVDLVEAALTKLEDSARRYPIEQVRGSATKR